MFAPKDDTSFDEEARQTFIASLSPRFSKHPTIQAKEKPQPSTEYLEPPKEQHFIYQVKIDKDNFKLSFQKQFIPKIFSKDQNVHDSFSSTSSHHRDFISDSKLNKFKMKIAQQKSAQIKAQLYKDAIETKRKQSNDNLSDLLVQGNTQQPKKNLQNLKQTNFTQDTMITISEPVIIGKKNVFGFGIPFFKESNEIVINPLNTQRKRGNAETVLMIENSDQRKQESQSISDDQGGQSRGMTGFTDERDSRFSPRVWLNCINFNARLFWKNGRAPFARMGHAWQKLWW